MEVEDILGLLCKRNNVWVRVVPSTGNQFQNMTLHTCDPGVCFASNEPVPPYEKIYCVLWFLKELHSSQKQIMQTIDAAIKRRCLSRVIRLSSL